MVKVLNVGETQDVFAKTNGVLINGGNQIVEAGGEADVSTINAGGTQHIQAGGLAQFTLINDGGIQFDMGRTVGSVLNNGVQLVGDAHSGSGPANGCNDAPSCSSVVADGSVLNNGSVQTIYDDAVAHGTFVNTHSFQQVANGGAAFGTTVAQQGTVVVFDGGALHSATIDGGTVNLFAGASVDGTITFGHNAGMLDIGQSITTGQNVFGASIANIANGGNIDLHGLQFMGDDSHVTLNGNVLTVANGVASESFNLTGKSNTNFTVVNDGHGGTLLEACPPADAMVNTTGFSHDGHALMSLLG